MRRSDGAGLQYRWMSEDELARIAEIDRTERVRIGYRMDGGELVRVDVNWNIPPFQTHGEGDHSIAHQIAFCRGHLQAGGRMIGAFDGPTLAGVGVVTPAIRPATAQLAYLHVTRAYRRRGVGGYLAREMMAWARAGGARRMVVSATPSASAVGFYRSRGFTPMREPVPELLALEPEDIHMAVDL